MVSEQLLAQTDGVGVDQIAHAEGGDICGATIAARAIRKEGTTMPIELYHTAHSTCSQKVRLALAEKGLPERGRDWIEHEVDLGKFEQLEPAYLKMNPNGVVPTFVHNGQILCESSAIMEYLEEALPAPPLLPENNVDRARARAWMR